MVGAEYFGPILAVYVYDSLDDVVDLVDTASPYALSGAIFAQDRDALENIGAPLRFTAGNLYYNVKPTGAVVGQQPFGGGRASGTNDKAGSWHNVVRWTGPAALTAMLFASPEHSTGVVPMSSSSAHRGDGVHSNFHAKALTSQRQALSDG